MGAPRKERPILKGIKHGHGGYVAGCGCDVCRKAASDYQAKRRAERGRTDSNVISMKNGNTTESSDSVKRRLVIGPMEQAVIDEYELLDAECKRPTVLVAAREVARIVDDPKLQGMHIQATKQVMSMMESLRPKETEAKKRKSGGRLATVGNLTKVKRRA